MSSEAARDRQVAVETVRPRSECPSCRPGEQAATYAGATTPPDQHCFREDNCAAHPDHEGPGCCCGWLPAAHSGCDCD